MRELGLGLLLCWGLGSWPSQAQVPAHTDAPPSSALYRLANLPTCPLIHSQPPQGDAATAYKTGPQWDVLVSPYAHHWNDNPEHKRVNLISLDRYTPDQRFCGLALFTNSFGQASAYGHLGQRWDGLFGQPALFAKVSVGLIYGYRGAYKDKLPLNQLGIAPAIIPALGYQINQRDSLQIMMLGDAGFLLAWGLTF